MNRKYIVDLAVEERKELERLVSAGATAVRTVKRAQTA